MSDTRIAKFAEILTTHSTRVRPGDRVLIEATPAAEALVRELYIKILEKGGHPVPLIKFPDYEDWLITKGNDAQLDFIPPLQQLAYENFEARIRIHSAANTRSLSGADPNRVQRRGKATGVLTATQMRRGAARTFNWVTTLFPTNAYAQDAGMSLQQYEDFVFNAIHANEDDPIRFWKETEQKQQAAVDFMNGKNQVVLRGPNVDLALSVKGRTFINSCGVYNLPDGEIFTGPVEDSVNGWVKFTYPAIYHSVVVEDAELTFVNGKVTQATASKNQDYLIKALEADAGSRYLGEFAIGTNFDINKFTGEILFDEKIGGSFHIALGAGYPETGSKNKSSIHWDMICDIRNDSEILVDGELLYKDGKFVIG